MKNTESRVQELVADLKQIMEQKSFSAKQAQRIRGKMQLADSQVFGKTSLRCLAVPSDFTIGLKRYLDKKDIFFLDLFMSFLMTGTPRLLLPGDDGNVLIFTDACYERESRTWVCGIGGVLVDPTSKSRRFFSLELDEKQRFLLGEQHKKQIIFEAETLASVVAVLLWQKVLGNR